MTASFTPAYWPAATGSSSSIISIPVPFELPQGFAATTGHIYRHGHMRLATGADELMAHQAAEMLDNTAYSTLVRLSRVITLTDQPDFSPDDVGNLFMPDLTYLIELYNDINPPAYGMSVLGETLAILWKRSTRR